MTKKSFILICLLLISAACATITETYTDTGTETPDGRAILSFICSRSANNWSHCDQAASDACGDAGHDVPVQKRILEVNPDHPVVQRLETMADDEQFAEWSNLLYDQALIAEGALPADPGAFAKRIAALMAKVQ